MIAHARPHLPKVISLSQGFTMIELLMVIVVVSVLGAASLPQFLDFRNEGKKAAVSQIVAAVETGIRLQRTQGILRCGPSGGSISYSMVAANDNANCVGFIDDPVQRRIVDSVAIPANPFDGLNSVYLCLSGCDTPCAASCDGASWCYEANSGNFWAATNVAGECLL